MDPKYLEVNEYWALRSETQRKDYLIGMGIKIHNLLVDIKELMANGTKDTIRPGMVSAIGTNAPVTNKPAFPPVRLAKPR